MCSLCLHAPVNAAKVRYRDDISCRAPAPSIRLRVTAGDFSYSRAYFLSVPTAPTMPTLLGTMGLDLAVHQDACVRKPKARICSNNFIYSGVLALRSTVPSLIMAMIDHVSHAYAHVNVQNVVTKQELVPK